MKLKIRTSDHIIVNIDDHQDLNLSVLIRTCLEGYDIDNQELEEEIPLPNVSSKILKYILEFGKHYRTEAMNTIPRPLPSDKLVDVVGPWYSNFIERDEFKDIKVLEQLIKAANYLDIHPLQELGCAKIACMIRGHEPGEIRRILGLDTTATGES